MSLAERFRSTNNVPAVPERDHVVQFLSRHEGLVDQVREQAAQLSECAVEREMLVLKVQHLEAQLAKTRVELKMYMRGYFSLHANVGAFATLGADAMKSLASSAIKMLENANAEMRAAGIAPPSAAEMETVVAEETAQEGAP